MSRSLSEPSFQHSFNGASHSPGAADHTDGEFQMNKEQAKGSWNEFAGKVRQQWGKLTDDDIALLKGNRQEFYGKLQKIYGLGKEEVERQIKQIEDAYN